MGFGGRGQEHVLQVHPLLEAADELGALPQLSEEAFQVVGGAEAPVRFWGASERGSRCGPGLGQRRGWLLVWLPATGAGRFAGLRSTVRASVLR